MTMRRICLLSCMALFILPMAADNKDKDKARDSQYVAALSIADRFLTAWQWRRQDEGIALISADLKKRMSEDDIRRYISGISNPHHVAFEISSGKKLSGGRIAFKVMLFEMYTGYNDVYSAGPSTLILSKDAEGRWLVDKFPQEED